MLLDCNLRSRVHRESIDKNKYIDCTLESSANSVKTMVDYQTEKIKSTY